MDRNKQDYTLDARSPRVSDLKDQFNRCAPTSAFGQWSRSADSWDTRFAVWDGQSPDGKKHAADGAEARPWEGASDRRVMLADTLIEGTVDTLTNAFHRLVIQAEAVGGDDLDKAGVARSVLRYFVRNKLARALQREVELSAQFTHTFGHCFLQVTWEREIGRRNRVVTLDEVGRFSPEAELVFQDPTRDDEAVFILRSLYEAYIGVEAPDLGPDEVPEVTEAQLRKSVQELREEWQTTVPVPFISKNQPAIRALEPWQEVFLPEDCGDVQRGPAYIREFLRPDEVLARVNSMGWNRQWAQEAIKTKGKTTVWAKRSTGLGNVPQVAEDGSNKIEVVTAYTRRLDDDELPGVYVTVFCPHVLVAGDDDLAAQHGLLDYGHGLIPLVELTSEWIARSITMARGVPERAASAQSAMKAEIDATADRASLTTLPPRLVHLRDAANDEMFGPAATIPYRPGQEPKFMQLPSYDGASDRVQERLRFDTALQFGVGVDGVPSGMPSQRQQRHLNAFLGAWTEVFRQAWQLCCQYLSPEEFQRRFALPKPATHDIADRDDVMLAIDGREADMEYSLKKLEAINRFVLPEDSGGLIDRGELIRAKLSAIDPLLAARLVQGAQGASQKVRDGVERDLLSMVAGNPPRLVVNDPTAAMQLQFAQEIVASNPKYQQALAQDPVVQKAADQWLKNREQSVAQQQNKITGLTGVPVSKS